MFPSAPVQQGSLERRVVGEENSSELITLGTDPEKGKEKKNQNKPGSEEGKKGKISSDSQRKGVGLSISLSFSHSFTL